MHLRAWAFLALSVVTGGAGACGSSSGGSGAGVTGGQSSGASSSSGSGAGASSGTASGGGASSGGETGQPGDDLGSAGDGGDAGGRRQAASADAGKTKPADGGGSATVVTCPATALKPGDTNASVMVGGVMRNYILHVPTGYSGKTAVPLVLDFHPILSNDSYEQTNSGYATLADQEGFVVAFPDGIDNAWNIGPCCTTSRTVDDLGFAKTLVTTLEMQACVDLKRVYAVGYSMGGGMSHYLGCNAADVFAAVAPAAFDLLQDSEEPCHPSRPITEISFRGTADPIVPYAGGASNPPNGLNVTIHFLGAEGTFQKWSQLDGCTGSPSAPDSNGCSTYAQCQAGVEVTLCTAQGGGHVTGDPKIGWAMLKAHPMP
jgi:polyhydroxybutyrate depolymerase